MAALRMSDDLEKEALQEQFHKAMVRVYERALSEAHYPANRFLQMLAERGGLETARYLLHASTVSDGFTALWLAKRLDLTVEAQILRPEFDALFTQEERHIARLRLQEYGYSPPMS